MMSAEFNLVLKYCEALDEFVRIRVFPEEEARCRPRTGRTANKGNFQRHVVSACVLEHNPGLAARLDRPLKSNPGQDLVELLYLLCVEVNPAFEIHQVAIPVGDREKAKSDAAPARGAHRGAARPPHGARPRAQEAGDRPGPRDRRRVARGQEGRRRAARRPQARRRVPVRRPRRRRQDRAREGDGGVPLRLAVAADPRRLLRVRAAARVREAHRRAARATSGTTRAAT